MYSILDLKNDLEGILHGTTLNQIQNIDGVINRAARQLLLDIDPQETKRTVEFVAPIFNTVYDYPVATDVKGNKLIDIFPQVNRIPQDVWTQAYNQAFDVYKQNLFSMNNMFTMNYNTAVRTIRINAPWLNPPIIISDIDSIDDNGTWSVAGTASNLSANFTNFAQGAGSLQFNVTTGAASIVNSTIYPVNLTNTALQSSFFVWVWIPNASFLTSVNLRIGSSGGNYYSQTVTQTQQANSFVNGFNLCQFNWATMSIIGSPNVTSISFAEITLNVTGTMTGCLVNGLNNILGTVLEYSYYSKYLFRNANTGAFQETVLDDSDLINLDTDSYNLLFNQVAYLATQQQQGLDASFYDGNFFLQNYQQGIIRYKSMYKSELQKPQGVYYQKPNSGYSRIIGRGFGN